MLRAALDHRDNMWLDRLERLNDHVLDPVHHSLEIDPYLLEVVLELGQIPL